MIEQLTEKLMAWCIKRGKVFKITGTGGADDIYLIRYYVLKSRFLNIFIHQFLRSDRDDLHDHPWHFFTYLVRGAYDEKKWNPLTNRIDWTRRANYAIDDKIKEEMNGLLKTLEQLQGYQLPKKFAKNRFVFRYAWDQHQVLVDHDVKEKDKAKAPLTICVTGPAFREWGFIREVEECLNPNTPNTNAFMEQRGLGHMTKRKVRRWVPWREYLGLSPDTPGRG